MTVGGLVIMGMLTACAAMDDQMLSTTAAQTPEEMILETLSETTTEESVEESVEEPIEESTEESGEEVLLPSGLRLPAGHRIIYSDGEIYGWTRYEYDELGRKDMVIFITPTGNEYWSPVYYDGKGHVIPETVGDWSVLDDNGLYLEVGTEDSRKRRTPMAEYVYDAKGNLTDYWYMYVDGKYLRHMVYQYDSQDRLIREELHYARNNKLESYVEYIYNGEGYLIRKNEVEEAGKVADATYTIYQYDEQGRLSREEKIWGGRAHDYVDYYYNENGELIREYHYLEDPMMGGPFTIEYLFEAINDSAG